MVCTKQTVLSTIFCFIINLLKRTQIKIVFIQLIIDAFRFSSSRYPIIKKKILVEVFKLNFVSG